ncbi:MAG: hypothetical protein E7273_13800 [Pseudobutyrivibrio ruminis]|uniref:hypothetical protein n=1 Tax=Succinivibrio dextrinosolvens TaxID=83771 RepID=UPI00241E41AA|nr:hypothetical protein [Succinivibrio dextrinosolvens]MBE5917899.1 hypothetical protein [Pseudobutyrivibrio ruminis]MBE6423423.1 hypothetical protein [Succinivibrio dextrinosolvens]
MQNTLLVQVLSELVCQKEAANEYGVSIINIPEFDYVDFACRLSTNRDIDFFFLGFTSKEEMALKANLPKFYKKINSTYSFSTELAEESRNSGDEEHFRIFIIRRSELEKLSSLRWFPEITVDMVYNHSCKYVESKLGDSNTVIKSIITALKRKSIRKILGFENVMDYLNCLINAPMDDLFSVVKDDFYKLGLLKDNSIDQGNPTTEAIVSRIKRNHELVEKIGNLEQNERQSITNYYSSESSDKTIPGLILNYYSNKNALLLGKMELSLVEACLKAAKKKPNKTKSISKTSTVNSTALASQLIFDDNPQQIESVLSQMESDIDNRSSSGKKDKIDIDVDGVKLQVRVEPTTEKIARDLIDEMNYGGIIHADVNSPDEAISDIEKYDFEPFSDALLDSVLEKLEKIAEIVPDGENISSRLKGYLNCRKRIARFSTRLQDAPMFSILANMESFKDFLSSYEALLIAINNDYAKILNVNAASSIKYIINTIISLDNIFVVSENNIHAIPTPLNPLYLWKYIKLAEEILESKGVDETNENVLSDVDKSFIIRKADDIPDPLSVMLVPYSVYNVGGYFFR